MIKNDEVLIENEGDIVYDVSNIVELDHFDIGEEGCSDPEEITSNNIWTEEQRGIPLSRQKTRKGIRRKPGRKTSGRVIHIPKKELPQRSCRVKSFQQYATFEAEVEKEQSGSNCILEEDIEMDNDEDAEESTSKTWRVFVRKDGTGLHFDCPIFSDSAITLNNAVSIIASNASNVPENVICGSIPQEFTSTGSFLIQLDGSLLKEEICDDGLGTWHQSQVFVRKYIIGNEHGKPVATQKNDHNLKIVCEQFIHPGTDSRGDFIRKIYTGFNRNEHMIPFIVISYEWMGIPHPLTVYEEQDGRKFEQNTWKRCANADQQVPILTKYACDYNVVISILLSTEKFTEYGRSLPMFVQESISFVLNVADCGGDRALFSDGNEWDKPSGSSRYYKVVHMIQNDESSWKIDRSTNRDYDIQVICRRYVGKRCGSSLGFVRKIYLVKVQPSCPEHVTAELPNIDLAVVTYSWSDTQFPAVIQPILQNEKMKHGEEVIMLTNNYSYDGDGNDEMRENKKKMNQRRLYELLQRVNRLDLIWKKYGWSPNCEDVQLLLEVSQMLDVMCK